MSTHREDRGLAAVRRVREVRETDSRIGLQTARAEESAALVRVDTLGRSLSGAVVPVETTPAALLAQRTALAGLGDRLVAARGQAESAGAIAVDARARWTADRTRLAAVEHLLARRAEVRRTEAERRAAAEADDIATQRWLRGAAARRATTEGQEDR